MTIRQLALATAMLALFAVATAPAAFAQSQSQDPATRVQDGNNAPTQDGNGASIARDPALIQK